MSKDGGATNTQVYADPNFADQIKGFFDQADHDCMMSVAKIDLWKYEDVVAWSSVIFERVSLPEGNDKRMPAGHPAWTSQSIQTFDNWVAKGFKKDRSDPGRPSPAATNKTINPDPNWEDHIKHYFLAPDVLCMSSVREYDFTKYADVRKNAPQIYQVVWQKEMPPRDGPSGRQWSTESVRTFGNWMVNGYPQTASSPRHPTPPAFEPKAGPKRVRKNLADLDVKSAEFKNLKKAFETIMDQSKRPDSAVKPNDPKTWNFQYLAGQHYFWCMHHVQNFLTWHRVYIQWMEEALRTVEGCENVTMPYWDFMTVKPLPQWMFEAPFGSYTLSQAIGNPESSDYYFHKGYVSSRVMPGGTDPATPKSVLESWLTKAKQIWPTMIHGMSQDNFEDFQGLEYRGLNTTGEMHSHDMGHNQTGPTMQNSLLSSFDPSFWFFHCNHDRLFALWQVKHNATTLDTFRQHITKVHNGRSVTQWLDTWPINQIPPFRRSAADTIDLAGNFNVEYTAAPSDKLFSAKPTKEHAEHLKLLKSAGSAQIDNTMTSVVITDTPRVSIRVSEFNRLKVKGTFVAKLYALNPKKNHARTLLDEACVFQVPSPDTCPSCTQTPFVAFHFDADLHEVQGKELYLEIESEGGKRKMPGSIGEPKMNVRLLLDTPETNAARPQCKRQREEAALLSSSSASACPSASSGGCPFKSRRLESCVTAFPKRK